MMKVSKPSACQNSASDESDEVIRFDKSLKELRDLRSQLHYAADYCEATFSKAKEKKIAVENTKEYICRAVVAVVDHLGCVSANLSSSISKADTFSEAELRINCLKQRLLSCEQFAHKVALTRVRWSANLPSLHRRYLSTQITSGSEPNEGIRGSASAKALKFKQGFEAEDLPLFLCTHTQKSSSTKSLSSQTSSEKGEASSTLVLPICDGLSILSKQPNPTFHFQQITQKNGRRTFFTRSTYSNDILSLIRRVKQGR